MKKETILEVKDKYVSYFKSGSPLIPSNAIVNVQDAESEGDLIQLEDRNGQFIAKGYTGKQNKGAGWILSRNKKETIDYPFFETKLKAAFEYRKSFFGDPHTNAFRVFNGEGDGIGGLTIDYFDGYYLLTWYSAGVFGFKDYILRYLEHNVQFKGIYEKKRFNEKGAYVEDDDFVLGERGEFPIIVKENDVNFAIYLNDGAMVGVFLDQREVRKTIRDRYAKGKSVLNMFSYTGAFSVFAAKGGAVKTTSVDLANRSKAKTIEQFSINGIDYEAQDIIVEDVFRYLKYAVKKQLAFDLIIVDPPSFARSKKHTFSAAKDYKDLLKSIIAITEKNGVIAASTNASSFNMNKFKGFIDTAFRETGEKYKILEKFSLPGDFKTLREYPEGNYLKVVFIEKLS